MEVKKFDEFLNEAVQRFKAGDIVRVVPLAMGTVVDYGSDNALNRFSGMIVKIERFEKGSYICKLLYGAYIGEDKKVRHRRPSQFDAVKFKEKFLTSEGVKDFLEIIKSAKFKVEFAGGNEKNQDSSRVAVEKGTECYSMAGDFRTLKSASAKALLFDVEHTLKFKEPCYIMGRSYGSFTFEGSFKESDLKPSAEIDKNAIVHVAKALAEKIGAKLGQERGTYQFELATVNTSKMISPNLIHFNNEKDMESFYEGIESLIDRYVSKEAATIKGKEIKVVKTDADEDDITLSKEEIMTAAKDIGLDVDKIIDDNLTEITLGDF